MADRLSPNFRHPEFILNPSCQGATRPRADGWMCPQEPPPSNPIPPPQAGAQGGGKRLFLSIGQTRAQAFEEALKEFSVCNCAEAVVQVI